MAAPIENVKAEKSSENGPNDGRCRYFMVKKRRKCNLVAKAGTDYCGEHRYLELGSKTEVSDKQSIGLAEERVRCPLNPNHTCWSHKLERHLKVCRKQQEEKLQSRPAYHVENINSGELWPGDDEHVLAKVSAKSVPLDELVSLISRVEALHDQLCTDPDEQMLVHEAMEEGLAEAGRQGENAEKHFRQEASILAHLSRAGLLTGGAAYVEFGVGNGHLTYRLAQQLEPGARILAVDRFTVRYKFDRRQDFAEKDSVTRLKIDIEHLDLAGIPELSDYDRVVGYSKHLCGPATDLTLRCVTNNGRGDTSTSARVEGLIIALCCHHRGSWRSYVGKEFFRSHGLSSRDYHVIQSLTSWATCGFHQNAKKTAEKSVDADSVTGPNGAWSPARRTEVGLKCKRLLDQGRVEYLSTHGYSTRLVRYVPSHVTRENVLMIVTRSRVKTRK